MADEGLMNAAILLMSLGEEEASEVFKYLSPKEVQSLGETMAKLKVVDSSKIDSVLTTFQETTNAQRSLVSDTDEYVRNVLNKALGNEKAGFLIDRILQGKDVSGIEGLKWMDAATVAELIRNEHPQIIASILVHLERDQASSILALMTERTRNDVILRIATLDGIQPNALKELNEVLTKVLAGSEKLKKTALGGVKTTAEILNFMGSSVEAATVESIRAFDPDLAQKVMDQMFTFDNLLELDDKAIQLVLREVQSESLVVALKGADAGLRDKILKNMSQRAAETLSDDLESKGPVRVSEVEAEQKEILKIIRRLAEEGQIALGGKGEEAFV
ncbi:MAG: flagellar motor switch protein FliG [Betaproteobacteria bacterium]|nr:flagellar motor switch protein FliG [Betaproteobacteria bacterium]